MLRYFRVTRFAVNSRQFIASRRRRVVPLKGGCKPELAAPQSRAMGAPHRLSVETLFVETHAAFYQAHGVLGDGADALGALA
jgi:hypothetical protein